MSTPFARELRLARGLEVHAGTLLRYVELPIGDCSHTLRVALDKLVERGVIRPVRHAPWMPIPPFLHQTFCSGDGVRRNPCSSWESRRSPPWEWFYSVPTAPAEYGPIEDRTRRAIRVIAAKRGIRWEHSFPSPAGIAKCKTDQ